MKLSVEDEKLVQAVVKDFVAGGVSGAISTVLFQPFDVVKTYMQGSKQWPPPGIRDSIRHIFACQGVTGLWAGTTPAIIRVGLGSGLYFAMLNPILSFLSAGNFTSSSTTENLHKQLPVYIVLAAGAFTRSATTAVVSPITVLKTRMEYQTVSGISYPNVLKAIEHISRTEGLKGLYSGLLPTILRDAPYSGLYLLLYSTTQRTISELQDVNGTAQMQVNFLAGAVSGATATIVTHPPDVIRAKLQLESAEHAGIFSIVHQVYKWNGVGGFFNGVVPRAGRRALYQAFSWTIYEELIQWFQNIFGK